MNYDHSLSPMSNIKRYARVNNCSFLNIALSELESGEVYNKTTPWRQSQDDLIRIAYNRMPLDEICEAFMCSHIQLEDRARLVGHTLPDKQMTAEDLELIQRLLDNGMDIQAVLDTFDIDIPRESFGFTPKERAELIDYVNKHESQQDLFKQDGV